MNTDMYDKGQYTLNASNVHVLHNLYLVKVKIKLNTKFTLMTSVPWLTSLADARFEVTIPTVGVRAENGAIRTVISWIGTTWGKYHVI